MPRKTFSSGEILTAADVNLYLSNEAIFASSTATTYSVLPADRYETLVFSNTAAGTVTIGTATAFEAGERIDIVRDGTATLEIRPDGTATLLYGAGTAGTAYSISDRFGAATVLCVGTNSYRVIGGITAL
jgi:hypothetical protein